MGLEKLGYSIVIGTRRGQLSRLQGGWSNRLQGWIKRVHAMGVDNYEPYYLQSDGREFWKAECESESWS